MIQELIMSFYWCRMSGSAPQDSDSDDELLFVDEEGSVKSPNMINFSLNFISEIVFQV